MGVEIKKLKLRKQPENIFEAVEDSLKERDRLMKKLARL